MKVRSNRDFKWKNRTSADTRRLFLGWTLKCAAAGSVGHMAGVCISSLPYQNDPLLTRGLSRAAHSVRNSECSVHNPPQIAFLNVF